MLTITSTCKKPTFTGREFEGVDAGLVSIKFPRISFKLFYQRIRLFEHGLLGVWKTMGPVNDCNTEFAGILFLR